MRKRTISAIILAAGLLAVTAAPATAQDYDIRGFVGGLGGVTFGTASSSGVAGVQGGYRISPGLFVIGEFGRFADVLPSEILDDARQFAEFELDAPVEIDAVAPATYVFGGIRWTRGMGRAMPFFEAGIGAAHGDIEIREVILDGADVTDFINTLIEASDVETSGTDFLWTFGGGVSVAITDAVSADAGYRFTRIATDDPNVNVSAIYGAVKILVR